MRLGRFTVMLRRTLPAAAMLAAFLASANPASAAMLCTGGEDFVDDEDGICRNFFPGDNAKFYLFDSGTGFEHLLRITVDEVLFGPEAEDGDPFTPGDSGGFGLRIVANSLPAGSTYPGFPELTCVAYGPPAPASTEPTCIEYQAIDDEGDPIDDDSPPDDFQPFEGFDYEGDVTWLISWSLPGVGLNSQIIHEIGEFDLDEVYDEALETIFFSETLGPSYFACDAPYTATCDSFLAEFGGPTDPTRAGESDNFTNVALVQVPEPGTLALLGLGASGLLLNRRRRGAGR